MEFLVVIAFGFFVAALLDPILRPDEVVDPVPFGLRGA